MSTGSPIDLTLRFVAIGGNSDGGWLPGIGTPPPEYGGIGNRYVDVVTGNIYGPKTNTGWPNTPAFTLNLGNVTGAYANMLSRVPRLEVLTANQGAKITALETQAIAQAGLSDTHGTSIDLLETAVATHTSEIDELQRLMGLNDTSLPTRMLAAEDELTRLSGQRDTDNESLNGSITEIRSELRGNSSSITSLQETFTGFSHTWASDVTTLRSEFNGNIATLQQALNTQADANNATASLVTTLTAAVNGNTAAITEEATVRASAVSALASRVTTMESKFDGNIANITQQQTTLVNDMEAYAATSETLTAELEATKAQVTTTQQALATAETSLASQITELTVATDSLDGRITSTQTALIDGDAATLTAAQEMVATSKAGLQAAINLETTARLTADQAEAQQRTLLDTKFTNANSALRSDLQASISAESTARANAITAEAQQRNLLDVKFTNANAALRTDLQASISAESTARTTALAAETAARNSQVSAINTNVGNVSAAVNTEATTRATVDGYLGSRYTLNTSTTSGGYTAVAGMEIASTSQAGKTATNYIAFYADRFYIAHTASNVSDVPFEVVGGAVKIKTAMIQDASIDTLHIKGNAVTVPTAAYNAGPVQGSSFGTWHTAATAYIHMDQPGIVQVIATAFISYGLGWAYGGSRLLVNGGAVSEHAIDECYSSVSHGYSFWAGAGGHHVTLQFTGVSGKNRMHYASICLLGAKR